jgi:phage terminase large subunit
MILKTRLSSPICGNLPNQLFLSFNPEDEYCWIKEKVIDADTDCLEIPSSYRDNPFLSNEYRKILEDLEKQDINYWRIYGLGQWGKLTNLIYNNWKIVDDLPISRSNVIYGLDFGFNNPSALIKLYMDGNEVGVEEKIYETGLTTTDLISRMEEAIPKEHRQNHPIYADNAEPDRILEINNAGFWCLPCHKVSVREGIDDVKQFQLYSLSTNFHYNKEVKTYSWRQDKNDKILDEPVKYNDHLQDAKRYALSTYVRQNLMGRPRIREL